MIAFITAALLTFCLTPMVIWLYRRLDWLDDPTKTRHVKVIHTQPIPRGGGISIFLAILIACALFLQFDKYLIAILIASLITVAVGVWDDVKNISPWVRLISNFLVALIVVGAGIGIAYVSNPFGVGVIHLDQPQLRFFIFNQWRSIWILADFLALIFIVWNMNIINWSSGIPGQMSGLVVISSCFIGLLSTKFIDDPTQFGTIILCFIVAGAYAGYLFWNWQPQKSMPGYGGSSLAGLLLSVLAILSGAKVATMLMVLAVPTADAVFTILRRLRAKKSPFFGDRGHMHHKLIDVLGWSQTKTAVFYWLSSSGLGMLSLYLNTWQKLGTIALVFGLVFAFMIWAKINALNIYKR